MKHQTITLRHRIISGILALSMLVMLFPAFGRMPASAAEGKIADPSTMDGWMDFFGQSVTDTTNAGGVWTDKSVFTDAKAFENLGITMDDSENFLVALSAIASNKSIEGYSNIPTDTMLILDVSGSMGPSDNNNDAVRELVAAANQAIADLQGTNKQNRVGVVLYSGNSDFGDSNASHATVLLELGRYTHTDNKYLVTNTNRNRVSINSNVYMEGQSNALTRSGKDVEGGTYIQNGIYQAMEQLLAADTVIEGDGIQSGTVRMPIMVLMSDGAPTTATTNYAGTTYRENEGSNWNPNWVTYTNIGTSNLGNGGSTNDSIAFATQLTAAYAKAKVEAHYGRNSLFYTLGFGSVSSNEYATSVLDPENSTDDIDELWEDYLALAVNGNLSLPDYNGRTVAKTQDMADCINEAADQFYVDDNYMANTTDQLTAAFKSIVQQIILQSLYYPTLISQTNHTDGYIQFIDKLGEYMEVKSIKGLALGDELFSGARFAKNFVSAETAETFLGTAAAPTDLGDHLIWAIIERLGIDEVTDADGELLYPTYEAQRAIARQLVRDAWTHGQFYYNSDTDFENYIGWYADANGRYLGFWYEGITDPAPAGAVYINKSYGMLGEVKDGYRESNMLYVSIQVHTEISTGRSQVIWRIPASLIPMVSYSVTVEGDDPTKPTKLTITDADPLRLIFEVGLRSDINSLNIKEKVSESYRNADGTYTFYTNGWSQDAFENEDLAPSEAINTVAFFEPSQENERYYYHENSTVYVKSGDSYAAYKGEKPVGNADGASDYYRAYIVYSSENGKVVAETRYETISAAALTKAKQFTEGEDEGNWYIPKGTIHRTVDQYSVEKTSNPTETLKYSNYASVESGTDYYYADSTLGNNGKLTVAPATGLVISKDVDATVTDRNAEYRFTVTGEDVANGSYTAILESADGSRQTGLVVFADGVSAEITLKAGQKIYITDLPAGDYTVSEADSETYMVQSINGEDAEGLSTATVSVTQYNITPVAFVNTLKTFGNVTVQKTVEHPFGSTYDIPDNLYFNFEITVTDSNGKPVQDTFSTNTGILIETDANGKDTFQLKADSGITLLGIDTGYQVTVKEIDLPDGFAAKDADATLSATVSEDSNEVLEFINTYTPDKVNPVNVTVEGKKDLTGRDWLDSDRFTFALMRRVTVDHWETIATQTVTKADPTFDFSAALQAQQYTAVGTYEYRIAEISDSPIGGVTYDITNADFSVTVTDQDMDGELEIASVDPIANSVAVSYDDSASVWAVECGFTNIYAPTGIATVTVDINKVLNNPTGVEIPLSGFEFGLYADGALVIASPVVSDANGEAQISLTFTANDAGKTFAYVLKEIAGDRAGMIYDSAVYSVEVSVVDNLDGTISAFIYEQTADESIPGGADGSYEATFTNTFDPTKATVQIEGLKSLDGRPMAADEFTFVLTETTAGSNFKQTVKSDSAGTFAFTLEYTKIGTYTYTITEQKGSLGGVTYDSAVYDLTVVVTEEDGLLQAVKSVTLRDSDGLSSQADADVVFVNRYQAAGSTAVSGEKSLDGRELAEGEFTFLLYSTDSDFSTTGKTPIQTTNNADGSFAFKALTYTEAQIGTHYYVVTEKNNGLGGVGYDGTVYNITVTVSDNGDGTLTVTQKITYADGTEAENGILFENTYTTESVTDTAIGGTKELSGRNLATHEFSFILTEVGGTYTETVKNTVDAADGSKGAFAFTPITYTSAGTYTYTVEEEKGTLGGVAYDPTVYTVTVKVEDNGEGELEIVSKTITVEGEAKSGISFTNTYNAKETTVSIEGLKTLIGRDLAEGMFTFLLTETTDGADYTDTAKNTADGAFVFDEITYTEAGVYTYKVEEEKGTLDGITYATAWYTVSVTVEDNGVGELIASTEITNEHGAKVSEIHFTNFHTADAINVILRGTKILDGRALAEGEFNFALYKIASDFSTDGKTPVDTVSNTAGGHFFFELGYSDTAEDRTTHYYVIEELSESSQTNGVTNDTAKYYVTVAVSKNADAELEYTLTVVLEKDGKRTDVTDGGIVFTNTYKAEKATVSVEGYKKLDGRALREGEFTFLLYTTGSDFSTVGKTPVQTVTNNTNGSFAFDLSYTSDDIGTHYYVIAEQSGTLGGIAYDDFVYNLTVVVEDNGKGQIVATVTVADAQFHVLSESEQGGAVTVHLDQELADDAVVSFTNTYKASPVTDIAIGGTKELVGRDLATHEFSFILTEVGGTYTETVKNTENATVGNKGSFAFSPITYTSAGTYTYTVREVDGELGGVAYDSTVYTVLVKVEDNGNGALEISSRSIAVGAESKDSIAFTNSYGAEKTDITIAGTKSLTGRKLAAGEFSFLLTETTDGADYTATASNKADGSFAFDKITYTKAGVYTYVLTEKAGDRGGVTYDQSIYTVTVTVTDDGYGKLHAAQSITHTVTVNGEQISTAVDGIIFHNTYSTAPDTILINGVKKLEGRPLYAGEFAFVLSSQNADGSWSQLQIKYNDASAIFAFDPIHYTEIGTYTYRVTEQKGTRGGITYDATEYLVTVQVTDDGNGNLIAQFVDENGKEIEALDIVFTNTYTAEDTEVTLSGDKTLVGREQDDGEFTFELYETDESFSITGKTPVQTAVNANGFFAFESIGYKFAQLSDALLQNGEVVYHYVVKEQVGESGGILYDATVYHITVTVRDNHEGALTATVHMTDAAGKSVQALSFVNEYTANPVTVEIIPDVQKTLNGRKMAAGEFSFALYQTGMHFAITKDELIQTKTNDAKGVAEFDALTFDAAGTYYYAVTEIAGTKGGVLYDATEYRITVTVKDNLDGTLSASKTMEKVVHKEGASKTETASAITFANTYTASDVSVTLEGVKTLNGRAMQEGEFRFALYRANEKFNALGSPEMVSNDADGAFAFAPITYRFEDLSESLMKNGEVIYRYVVVETNTRLGGIAYDEAVYHVTVTVTDDGEGRLIAATSITNEAGTTVEGISFTNTYIADSASVVITGDKVLTNKTLQAGEFSFALYATDETFKISGEALDIVTNDAGGRIVFDALIFDAAGTYHYAVAEIAGEQSGVTYDETVYCVTVTVTDNGEGKLVASEPVIRKLGSDAKESQIKFVNEFVTDDITVEIAVDKTVQNTGDLEIGPEDFEFSLEDLTDGKKTVRKTDKDGLAVFGLTFSMEDVGKTFIYKLSEIAGNRDGVTYSDTVYSISITISQAEDGSLVASVTVNGAPVEKAVAAFENVYHKDEEKPNEEQPIPPKTGDDSTLLLWAALMLLSSGAILTLVVRKKRRTSINN